MKTNKVEHIKIACKIFVEALGDTITNSDLFPILADIAELKGYELVAEQGGIRGTYIHFRKKSAT